MALIESESESENELVDSLNWSQLPLLEQRGDYCVYTWSNWSTTVDVIFADCLFPSLQDKQLHCSWPQGVLAWLCSSVYVATKMYIQLKLIPRLIVCTLTGIEC